MDDHQLRIDSARQLPENSAVPTRGSASHTHPLGWLTRQVLRVPRLVLLASLVLAAGSVLLAWGHLGFHTSRLDLLNPKSEYNQRWLAYLDEFGRADDAVIVVQGTSRARVVKAIDGVAHTLRSRPELFSSVLSQVDTSVFRSKGLHYCTIDQLQVILRFTEQLAPALRGQWDALDPSNVLHDLRIQRATLDRIPDSSRAAAQRAQIDAQIEQLCTALLKTLDGANPGGTSAPVALMDMLRVSLPARGTLQQLLDSDSDGHFIFAGSSSAAQETNDNGLSGTPESQVTETLPTAKPAESATSAAVLGMILVRIPVEAEGAFVPGREAIEQLRAIVRTERSRYRSVEIGLTGLPILENDEMRTSQTDMAIALAVSLFGVACLFIAGFGGLRLPLLTVAALLIAMAWSLGFITLSVGHLNILSISFGAILIGLGIDFGIHYVTQYAQQRSRGLSCDAALEQTATRIGGGVVTGGLTTALAFLAAALTDFTGVAELGIIAGGGIVLCVLAAIVVLPALIHQTRRRDTLWQPPHPLPFHLLCVLPQRLPRLFLALSVLVTLVMAAGTRRLTFDHNLLHLQAEATGSVIWEHRLLDSTDRSVWFALSISADQAELARKKRQFEQLATVQRVEEIDSLLPVADPNKARIIAQIARRLVNLPKSPPKVRTLPVETLLAQVNATVRQLGESPAASPQTLARLAQVTRLLQMRPAADATQEIHAFHTQSITSICTSLGRLREMADPIAPTLLDLPPAVASRFIGRNSRHLMRVYARGNIWDHSALADFVHDLESVDPRVTGHPVQTYYASQQMEKSYIHAAIYALIAVAIVLMLDLHSVRMTLSAMLPMTAGLLQMLGLLGWLGIPLNPANMIVLPLILGIGIDDGVHMVHDFLHCGRPFRVSRATAAAVVLTSATTMVGFGSMMLARHQGLRSLGQVLTLGVFCCLVTTLMVLPAWLNQMPWTVRPESRDESVAAPQAAVRDHPARRASQLPS